MSEFSVVTSMVEGMSARLGVISGDVTELHGQVAAHSSAAAQTPLHGALSGLMGDWAAMLPHFGLAGDRLQGAMRGAAGAYCAADAAVSDAAGASVRR
jgi:hypothetical protein